MPSSCAISLRLADVGLLSVAKYCSSLASCSGLTRDRFRLCFTATAPPTFKEEQEMARRRMGFSALSGIVAESGAMSDSVGESAVEGDDAADSRVS